MKHSLDTPTVTAHALGELLPVESRLLQLTFAEPHEAAYLEEAAVSVRKTARSLREALQADVSPEFTLTDAQRECVLALTTAPFPAGTAAVAETKPLTLEKILAERKSFDRRPSRLATYLTLGAAAAVVLLLMAVRTKTDTTTSTTTLSGSGNGTGTNVVTHFKIVTAPSAAEPAQPSRPSNIANSTELPEVAKPQGFTLPRPDLTIPEPATPGTETPQQTAQKNGANNLSSKPKPSTYAVPKSYLEKGK